jgi:hypothetical protein
MGNAHTDDNLRHFHVHVNAIMFPYPDHRCWFGYISWRPACWCGPR